MLTSSNDQHFPGYEILEEIGRGNARVVKARNIKTGELVAIKHFFFNTDEATLNRFQQESKIMTTIQSPNIVKIKDMHLDAVIPFIAMEFIEGGNLRSLLEANGSLEVSHIIRLGLQMAEAFKAIHQEGIIHRDIKPENIMYRLLPSGELHFLLTDFGIAKIRAAKSNTLPEQSLMTYEYASPEQFSNSTEVNSGTDYYSLGIVLYECLNGKLPFVLNDNKLTQFVSQVANDPPPPLSIAAGRLLPENLMKLISRLMEKNAENRLSEEYLLTMMLKRAELEIAENYRINELRKRPVLNISEHEELELLLQKIDSTNVIKKRDGIPCVILNYDFIYSFTEGLAIVVKKGKHGFIDKFGKLVIELTYDTAGYFYNGMAKVSKDKRYGFIDRTGGEIVPTKYDDSSDEFVDGVAIVMANHKYGFINTVGKMITLLEYDEVDHFCEGLARVKKGRSGDLSIKMDNL